MNLVRLRDLIIDIKSGFACGEDESDGIVQFRMNNVSREGNLDWSKLRRIPQGKYRTQYQLLPGDILFNATNSVDLVGKTALFTGYKEPVTFSNHFIRLRLDEKRIDSRYATRWLQQQFSAGLFAGICRSWVNQASITSEQLRQLVVPLPELNEQRRIAEIFDHADELRRKRRLALDRLKNLRQAIFNEMFGDLASNMHNFEETTVGHICAVKGGKRLPKGTTYAGTPTPFRYIRVVDFTSGFINEDRMLYLTPQTQQSIRRYTVHTGDIIVSIAGSIGLVAEVPESLNGANFTENAAKLEAYDWQRYSPTFLTWLLRSPFCQSQIAASTGQVTIGKLALFRLEKLCVPLPPKDLQNAFENRIAAVQTRIMLMLRSSQMIDQLFTSLQHHAFFGSLDAPYAKAITILLNEDTFTPVLPQ